MRISIPQQDIVKCICKANSPVTYTYLMCNTKMGFVTIETTIKEMLLTGRVEIAAGGGFILTKHSRNSPIVRLLLQEMAEERLWMPEPRFYSFQRKLVRFINARVHTLAGWAGKVRMVVFGR